MNSFNWTPEQIYTIAKGMRGDLEVNGIKNFEQSSVGNNVNSDRFYFKSPIGEVYVVVASDSSLGKGVRIILPNDADQTHCCYRRDIGVFSFSRKRTFDEAFALLHEVINALNSTSKQICTPEDAIRSMFPKLAEEELIKAVIGKDKEK